MRIDTLLFLNQIKQIWDSSPVHHDNKPATFSLFADLPCLCTADVTFRRVSFWSLLKYINSSYVGVDITL